MDEWIRRILVAYPLRENISTGYRMNRKKRVVIIGNSAAGLSALQAFRCRDRDSEVVMIDREPVCAYSRVITPYYIKGVLQRDDDLFIRTVNFYREQGVKTLFGASAVAVDTRKREVILERGLKEPFDLLLIATGAFPHQPPIEEAHPETHFVLRTLEDAKRLRTIKAQTTRGLFLGAGLVTLQTLQAMRKTGDDYTLVIKSERVLSQTLDAEAAEIVERRLAEMKVRIIKGQDIVRLEKRNDSQMAILENGDEVLTHFLFVGKGVEPSVEFLEGSGIQVHKGVLVNSHLETNVEGVYAAGDVAQAPDFFSGQNVASGLWPAAVEQGGFAGKNMAGGSVCYPGNLKKNVSRIFGISLVSIGDFGSERVAEMIVTRDENRHIYRKFCFDRNGILIGAILINRTEDMGVIHGMIKARKVNGDLKALSIWKSSISYGFVYQNIMKPQFGATDWRSPCFYQS